MSGSSGRVSTTRPDGPTTGPARGSREMTVVHRIGGALLGLLLATLLLALPAPAYAADNGTWSVTPTPPKSASAAPRNYFVLEGEPGDKIRDSLRIKNFGRQAITFSLYGADGFNTAEGGFFALKGVEEPQVDLGGWVTLPVTSVEVAPRTQVDVPFTIKVPDNATPGDHVGGVVAMNTQVEATEEGAGFAVGVQRAVAVRAYVRVSGTTTPGLAVDDVRLDTDRGMLPWSGEGDGEVTFTVENIGNLRLSPRSTVTVTGAGGRSVATVESDALVDLLPGQKVTLTVPVSGIAWADRLTTVVGVTTPEGATSEARDVSWLTPWPGLLGIALLLAAGVAALVRRRTALRRGLQAAERAPLITVPAER